MSAHDVARVVATIVPFVLIGLMIWYARYQRRARRKDPTARVGPPVASSIVAMAIVILVLGGVIAVAKGHWLGVVEIAAGVAVWMAGRTYYRRTGQ